MDFLFFGGLGQFGVGYIVLALAISVSLIVAADYGWMLHRRRKMPPGPLPWPIVGNTFSLPDVKSWYLFEKLAEEYKSPVITFWIGRNPTVWINDAWSANEILVKRAAIYSSRPRMIVFAELEAGQSNLVNQYTYTQQQKDRFRVHRKLTHQGVGIQQVQRYRKVQDDESKVVAYDLLSTPEEYVAHFERYATSAVSIIGFGRRVSRKEDPMITEVIAVMHRAASMGVPAKTFPNLMETFPFLAYFPNIIAPWKHGLLGRPGRPGRRSHPFFYALAQEANESDVENYSKVVFREAPQYNLEPPEISAMTSNLLGAGSDTSSGTLITAVLAFRVFPETLIPAWEELDRVVGRSRSPTWDDDLPYMRALVKEVFRWRSVAIVGGIPHAPTQDDVWNGYLIPKGTWVQGNVWAIHHNERDFPEPDRFNPRRYMDTPDARPFPGEKGYMTFGWGRRSCAGQALAEQGTYLSVARLVWGFKVQPAIDDAGKEIPVDIFAYTDGSNWRPEPFQVKFVPRHEEIRKTIIREGQHALGDLAQYERETKYSLSTFGQKKA